MYFLKGVICKDLRVILKMFQGVREPRVLEINRYFSDIKIIDPCDLYHKNRCKYVHFLSGFI